MVIKSGFFILCLFFLTISLRSLGQEASNKIYTVGEVDSPPVFEGGEKDLVKYINKQFEGQDLVADGEMRNVFNSLVIDESGKIVSVEVLRGGGSEMNERITSFFMGMPNWTPAMKDEEPVKVTITLPVVIHGKK